VASGASSFRDAAMAEILRFAWNCTMNHDLNKIAFLCQRPVASGRHVEMEPRVTDFVTFEAGYISLYMFEDLSPFGLP
jgi:hypothetical protein